MVQRIKAHSKPAMVVSKESADNDKLVYILCASRRVKYQRGSSSIVYIGTTEKGITRMAVSVADRAADIFGLGRIKEFQAYVITCTPKRGVATWRKLERALLIAFVENYGEPPSCNGTGQGMEDNGEFTLFARTRIDSVLEQYEDAVNIQGVE